MTLGLAILPRVDRRKKRVATARRAADAEREAILHDDRLAKQAWAAMRRDVEITVTRLRTERKRLGLSLADVEERSGLRRSVISRRENDKSANPTLLTLQRYAAALKLTLRTTLSSDT